MLEFYLAISVAYIFYAMLYYMYFKIYIHENIGYIRQLTHINTTIDEYNNRRIITPI